MEQRSNVPCVILAGGQGRRIGGDKARVVLARRPLWQHVADRIVPQVSRVAVNAPVALGDLPCLPDETPDQGPLGGVLAAMDWAASLGETHVLTCAVDTPFLPLDLVARFSGATSEIVMAETADGVHGTTALWDVALAGDLRAALASGTRKVTNWTATRDSATVRFPDTIPPPFFNINTPQDLARAEAWL